ncbi:hypothetical protein J6590_076817 [Homalodisca vitripennis]|nr:hypothetical protein J6590_076817 [Homalodisca vitripennis]
MSSPGPGRLLEAGMSTAAAEGVYRRGRLSSAPLSSLKSKVGEQKKQRTKTSSYFLHVAMWSSAPWSLDHQL